MLKISSAAKLIGVTRQNLYKHIKAGNLKIIEIDGVKFVNRDELLILDAKWRDDGRGQRKERPQKQSEGE